MKKWLVEVMEVFGIGLGWKVGLGAGGWKLRVQASDEMGGFVLGVSQQHRRPSSREGAEALFEDASLMLSRMGSSLLKVSWRVST